MVVSAGAGAIALGFPVVVDVDLGENQVPGALESVLDHSLTVKKSLELRNIKIKVTELPIPVASLPHSRARLSAEAICR